MGRRSKKETQTVVCAPEQGTRVLEENIEIPEPQETWGERLGRDLAAVRSTHVTGVFWVPALQQRAPKLFSNRALPWHEIYQDEVHWPLLGLGGVGVPTTIAYSSQIGWLLYPEVTCN